MGFDEERDWPRVTAGRQAHGGSFTARGLCLLGFSFRELSRGTSIVKAASLQEFRTTLTTSLAWWHTSGGKRSFASTTEAIGPSYATRLGETYPAIARASSAVFTNCLLLLLGRRPCNSAAEIYEYGQACTRTFAYVCSIEPDEGDSDADNERVQLGISASD